MAVVLGPNAAELDVEGIEAIGGGWRYGVQLWRGLSFEYVLMLADSRKRLEKSAPLVLLAADREALLDIVGQACERMAGRECLWVVTDRGPGGQAVEALLAADTAVAGHA
jgi:hypothetical protein